MAQTAKTKLAIFDYPARVADSDAADGDAACDNASAPTVEPIIKESGLSKCVIR